MPSKCSPSESLSDSTAVFTFETLAFSKWWFSSARSSILLRSAICFLSSASLALFSALAVASEAFFLASLIFCSARLLTSATFSSVSLIIFYSLASDNLNLYYASCLCFKILALVALFFSLIAIMDLASASSSWAFSTS